MKTIGITLFIIFLSFSISAQEYHLRGKLVSIQPETHDTIALAEATVTLYSKNEGKWISLASSISNTEGIYFFEKVKAGNYFIQVNKKKNYKIIVEDKDPIQIQDLPLIMY